MNTIKSLLVATALTFSFITTGFASKIQEENDTLKRIVVNMGQIDVAPIYLDKAGGWGRPEGTHRWTTHNYTNITVPVMDGDKRLNKITVNLSALASDSHEQKLRIYFSSETCAFHNSTYKNMNPFQISWNFPTDFDDEDAVFIFIMDNCCKPEVLDPKNKDPRKLGFLFTDIELEYTKK